jgi:hypothetical protein
MEIDDSVITAADLATGGMAVDADAAGAAADPAFPPLTAEQMTVCCVCVVCVSVCVCVCDVCVCV